MADFHEALVERVARAIDPEDWRIIDIHTHPGAVDPDCRAIDMRDKSLAHATTALTASGLDEAIEALEPFALAADDLDEKHGEHGSLYEAPATLDLTAGHLRRAKAVRDKLRGQS